MSWAHQPRTYWWSPTTPVSPSSPINYRRNVVLTACPGAIVTAEFNLETWRELQLATDSNVEFDYPQRSA